MKPKQNLLKSPQTACASKKRENLLSPIFNFQFSAFHSGLRRVARAALAVLLVSLLVAVPVLAYPSYYTDTEEGYVQGEPPTWPLPPPPPPGPEPPGSPDFPDWVLEQPMPNWMFEVDEFPDWFFELEQEPVWFHQITRLPAWFFTITEIPDWFFPEEGEEPEYPYYYDPEDPDYDYEYPEEDYPEEPGYYDPEDPGYYDPEDFDGLDPEREPPTPERRMYETSIGGGLSVFSSVPNGMITNGPVYLVFSSELVTLTRNGMFHPHTPGEPLEAGGIYALTMQTEDFLSVDVLSFRIITVPVNDLISFNAPYGFVLSEVILDGISLLITDPRGFETLWDGVYEFTVSSARFGTTYEVTVTKDTVPPQLIFTQLGGGGEMEAVYISVEGNSAFEGPVIFSGEEGYILHITLGRDVITPLHNILTEPGRYNITVTDIAGNTSFYSFRILYVMNFPTVWVIIITSALAIWLAVYLVKNRMKARVR